MSSFEDYEVLSILGTNLNSTCYKVKNKLTSELFVWKAINFEKYQEDTNALLEKVEARKSKRQPTLLQFYDHILHEDTETIYLVTEYCKYGCLFNIVQNCIKNNEYIDENFIWYCLYKLACHFKLDETIYINLHDIFVDVELNIKLLNFTLDSNKKSSDVLDLGVLVHNLVHLNKQFKKLVQFPEYYSTELKGLLDFLIDTEGDVKPSVDVILCHPKVLLKISQGEPKEIFVKNLNGKNYLEEEKENVVNVDLEAMYQAKLENLRNRESALKTNEEKMKERGLVLDRREKKVALMERMVREKMARAELYLRRARDLRSTNTGSTKDVQKKQQLNQPQDTSLSADCGDTSILPTSKKLDTQTIKPPRFNRTLSERRVRFKSHSPLKEIHNYRREMSKHKYPDIKEHPKREQRAVKKLESLPSDSDRVSESNSEKLTVEKTKKKFLLGMMFNKKPKKPNSIASSSDSFSAHTYEDLDKHWGDELKEDVQPINWNEESKRQAFDLLRIMNEEGNVEQIKHTYL